MTRNTVYAPEQLKILRHQLAIITELDLLFAQAHRLGLSFHHKSGFTSYSLSEMLPDTLHLSSWEYDRSNCTLNLEVMLIARGSTDIHVFVALADGSWQGDPQVAQVSCGQNTQIAFTLPPDMTQRAIYLCVDNADEFINGEIRLDQESFTADENTERLIQHHNVLWQLIEATVRAEALGLEFRDSIYGRSETGYAYTNPQEWVRGYLYHKAPNTLVLVSEPTVRIVDNAYEIGLEVALISNQYTDWMFHVTNIKQAVNSWDASQSVSLSLTGTTVIFFKLPLEAVTPNVLITASASASHRFACDVNLPQYHASITNRTATTLELSIRRLINGSEKLQLVFVNQTNDILGKSIEVVCPPESITTLTLEIPKVKKGTSVYLVGGTHWTHEHFRLDIDS